MTTKAMRSDTLARRFLKKDVNTGKQYEILNRKAAEKANQALSKRQIKFLY